MRAGNAESNRRYAAKNREKIREWAKKSYRKHWAKRRATYRLQYAERRAWVDGLKAKPCQDCGQAYPAYVMEWHHRDPKTKVFKISVALCYYHRDKVLAEIAKCDLLCANCHRIREWGENGLRKKRAA